MEPEVYTPVCDWHLRSCIFVSFGWRPIKEEDRDLERRIERSKEETLSWLMQQEIEFVPIVENPDPTQLERLGVPPEGIKKAIMDAAERMEWLEK